MWEIIGHKKQIHYLEKDIQNQTVKHAYLFSGPEKVGKFTLVRRFAKLLQCQRNGCNTCAVCTHIDHGTHPDTVFHKDHGETIKVDEIREIIERTNRTFQSAYFLVCIENIERMTEETSNALLKTLEEPPKNVLFLLTTVNINKILPTVLSRVFVIELGGVEQKELLTFLKQQFPQEDDETLENTVNLSANKPGLAVEMLQHRDIYEYYTTLYNNIRRILTQSSPSDRLAYVDQLLTRYKDDAIQLKLEIKNMLEMMSFLLRNVLLTKLQKKEHHILLDKSVADVMMSLDHIQRSKKLIDANINKRLVLENLMLYI